MTIIRMALITNDVVTDIVLADDAAPISGYVECGATVGVGWDYDSTLLVFSAPAVTPYVPTVTDMTNAVQNHLDARARTMNYDNIFTAISYISEPVVPQFQAEAVALSSWRSNVWAACYVILADIEAETRTTPTIDELMAELDASTPYVPPV